MGEIDARLLGVVLDINRHGQSTSADYIEHASDCCNQHRPQRSRAGDEPIIPAATRINAAQTSVRFYVWHRILPRHFTRFSRRAKCASLPQIFGFSLMNSPQRNVRVTKWLSTTPVVGVCSSCSREFKVPMTALSKTKDAQTNLQQQFDQHVCKDPRLK
jgi:hypothetical protein